MSDVVENAFVHLDPLDNIVVCVTTLKKGQQVRLVEKVVELLADIEVGHKMCIMPIAAGEKVIKYGVSIGSAKAAITVGEHVHVHNLKSDYISSNVRN